MAEARVHSGNLLWAGIPRVPSRWWNLAQTARHCFLAARGPRNKWALSRYLLRNMACRIGLLHGFGEQTCLELDGLHVWIHPMQGELYLYKEIFVDDVYERHAAFRPRPGWCVFDVGANIGMFSLKVARNDPAAKIYAFEPHPETCQRLRRNLAANGLRNVIPLQKAAGAAVSRQRLSTASMSTVTRVVPDSAAASPALPVVDVVTLSDVIHAEGIAVVHLLKLDVEGAEAEVLRGAEGELSRIERIVMEYHSAALLRECESIVARHGFHKVLEVEPSYAYFVGATCRQ